MLWFIIADYQLTTRKYRFKYILCYGSSTHHRHRRNCHLRFKYILCYDSSRKSPTKQGSLLNLNTSYVMVHHATEADKIFIISFKYILYYGSSADIAIHSPPKTKFKYILCYGSSEFMNYIFHCYKTFKYILCYGSSFCVLF